MIVFELSCISEPVICLWVLSLFSSSQILKLCPKKKSTAAYTFCKAMGLLGMQFHLFENECESPCLYYRQALFGLLNHVYIEWCGTGRYFGCVHTQQGTLSLYRSTGEWWGTVRVEILVSLNTVCWLGTEKSLLATNMLLVVFVVVALLWCHAGHLG